MNPLDSVLGTLQGCLGVGRSSMSLIGQLVLQEPVYSSCTRYIGSGARICAGAGYHELPYLFIEW